MLRFWALPLVLLINASWAQNVPIPAAPQLAAKSYILLDSASGKVIAESSADERLEPASLTKLMTAYVIFRALEDGRISLDDMAYVSEKAWRTQGSRMFIEVDTRVSVEDLLRGMIIQSGNDASVALAEHLAGSEESFVELMNQYAGLLGMKNTSYRNSMGWPAEGHYSTARDSAILARAIITEFPEYYGLYAERDYTYNGIKQHNRNALLWRDDSVDGLKTGHTDAAGYCLVSSAERSGMRLISVVMGMASEEARADGSQSLLNYGFRFFETHRLYARGEQVTEARIWKGDPQVAALGLLDDLYVTIPRGRYDALSANMNIESELVAPIDENAAVGHVNVSLDGENLASVPLVALQAVPRAGLLTRMVDGVKLWFE